MLVSDIFLLPISDLYRYSFEQVIKSKDLTVGRGQGNHVSVEFNVVYRVRASTLIIFRILLMLVLIVACDNFRRRREVDRRRF